MKHKILKTETLFEGKIFNIKKDEILLENNQTIYREIVVNKKDAVAIVPIDFDGNVIFVKQYRHATLKEVLEIPAGLIEEGEILESAAIRELEEETSFKANDIKKLITIYPTVGICTEKIHIFLAQNLQKGNFNFDEDEFIEVVKYPLDKAIELIYKGEIMDAKTIAGLFSCKKFL